jgi:hypothetical protein
VSLFFTRTHIEILPMHCQPQKAQFELHKIVILGNFQKFFPGAKLDPINCPIVSYLVYCSLTGDNATSLSTKLIY